MKMLGAYLHEQERLEVWQDFTAQMLWYLNYATYARMGEKFEHKTWLDLVHPAQKDDRSAEQIIDDLKKQMIMRKKNRRMRK